MSNILEVQEVCKTYDNYTALDHVSVTVPKGAVFGLLGPNGAGKTSLIRIINQITAPDSGRILFNNGLLHPDHTASIGYLPEERGLYKKMEVGEQAVYLAQLKGMSRPEAIKRLKYWFERFEITGWWRKKIEELSKGMQQKVQFIVTVVHEPSLLILDEPFTGFDPINANLIKDELLRMRDNGVTIVLSTHRMESVEELCTHIALINKSQKLLEGSVRDVRRSYRNNRYEFEVENAERAPLLQLLSNYQVISHTETGDYFRVQVHLDSPAEANQLLQKVMSQATIHSYKEVLPSMNDIFIQTVSQTSPGNE